MRRRITVLAVGIVGVVLVLVGVTLVSVLRSQLYENIDRSLDQRAADVDASTRAEADPVLLSSDLEDHFAQVLDADGRIVVATDNAVDLPPDWELPADGTRVITEFGLPIEDDAFRVLIRVSDVDGVRRYTVVGENIDDLRDTMRALVVALAVVIPLAMAALGAAIWWLVGRTLRPVDEIRREVDEIVFDELSQRVSAPGTGDEVDQLADTMNRMLARLERASLAQRRFVADASHELRTPITRMRTEVEVEQLRPSGDADAVLASVLDDLTEMQRLVDDLLFLARHDASVRDAWVLLDIDDLIDDEVRAARALSEVAIGTDGVEALDLTASERDLRRLVRNLLSNAVRHAASTVTVSVQGTGDDVTIVVDDDGPGVAPVDRERVFERFVRLDEARGGRDGGTGLGLAIVCEIAEGHGGSVRIEDAPGGGARFVVDLPRHLAL